MRLVGYVRVSRVGGRTGDSFISPTVQREQIEALAKIRSHEVVEWIEDLDESGGKWERRGFQRALSMVESGEADGIAVAKLDRFARSVIDALHAIERIRAAGGELLSVTDNFDTTTAMGKAMLQITLVFAELERERQREGFRISVTRAIERGIHISTIVPVGYRRGADRRLVKDRKAARAIHDLFIRRAEGDSYGQLAAFLDRRLPRDGGGAWTTTTVAKILTNTAYLGQAHQGDIVNPDAHPAIVTRAEWEAAQPRPGVKRLRSGSLLTGLLRCGTCSGPLTRVSSVDYGCRARRAEGLCEKPVTIRVHAADEIVTEEFLAWASDQDVDVRAADRDDVIEIAVARLEAAEAEFVAYRDSTLVTIVGENSYTAGLRARANAVDDAQEALSIAQSAREITLPHYDAPSLWPQLDTRERRILIDSAIDHAIVLSGTLPPRDRLRIAWHDTERLAGLTSTQHTK